MEVSSNQSNSLSIHTYFSDAFRQFGSLTVESFLDVLKGQLFGLLNELMFEDKNQFYV